MGRPYQCCAAPVGYSRGVAPFFSAGQFAYGFIAVGQMATGVIAIGQVATGVIAIGQVARGGIAIGMGAVGLIAFGGMCVGLLFAGGGIGLGGRGALGLIVNLMPMPDKPRIYPPTSPMSSLDRPGARAWLPIQLGLRGKGRVHFVHQGRDLDVRIAAGLAQAAQRLASLGGSCLALISRGPGDMGLICERIIRIHRPRHRKPSFWLLGAVRLAVLTGLSYLLWRFAILPIGQPIG